MLVLGVVLILLAIVVPLPPLVLWLGVILAVVGAVLLLVRPSGRIYY